MSNQFYPPRPYQPLDYGRSPSPAANIPPPRSPTPGAFPRSPSSTVQDSRSTTRSRSTTQPDSGLAFLGAWTITLEELRWMYENEASLPPSMRMRLHACIELAFEFIGTDWGGTVPYPRNFNVLQEEAYSVAMLDPTFAEAEAEMYD